ncbi:MAG: hypothetical protein K0R17_71 [Rariglobus sp.]|jgi:hypothetical protein|nr:hypothetical protein [Rariglobus sp.]
MPEDSQIRINALLLEREALFVRIHEIERATSALLREPYPFTRPTLPSDQRVKRRSTAPGASPGTKEKLRKLEDDELVYRVTYRQLGQTRVETHDSPDALRTLLAAQGAQLQVQMIETLDAAGTVKAVLLK